MPGKGKELRKVESAARKAALSRAALIAAMTEARKVAPLRDVAQAAGMSHEAVRKIVARQEAN